MTLFSQITAVLERLENIEREWRARASRTSRDSRPVKESKRAAPAAAPAAVQSPTQTSHAASPSPASSQEVRQVRHASDGAGHGSEFPVPNAFAWPSGEAFEGVPHAFAEAPWGTVNSAAPWGEQELQVPPSGMGSMGSMSSSAAWPAFEETSATRPADFPNSFDAWPDAKTSQTSLAQASQASPMHARDLRDVKSSEVARASFPMQLHIRCSISDLEEVDRDQDRFRQQFVRAAAKAAGVPENRIRVKQIMNM